MNAFFKTPGFKTALSITAIYAIAMIPATVQAFGPADMDGKLISEHHENGEHPMHKGKHHGDHKANMEARINAFYDEIGVTAEQRAELKAKHQANWEADKPKLDELRAKRQEYIKIMKEEGKDSPKLAELKADMKATREEMRNRHREVVKSVLNAEQFAKFEAKMEEQKAHWKKRKDEKKGHHKMQSKTGAKAGVGVKGLGVDADVDANVDVEAGSN